MGIAQYKVSRPVTNNHENLEGNPKKDGGNGHHPEAVQIAGRVIHGSPHVNVVLSVSDTLHHLWFKIDTGSDRTVISAVDATAIGLAGRMSDGDTLDVIDFRGKRVSGYLRKCTFFFKPVGIAKDDGLIAFDADILVVDDDEEGPLEPVSSLLGLDLLAHFRLCMDLDSRVVTLDHLVAGDHNTPVDDEPLAQLNGEGASRLSRMLVRLNIRSSTHGTRKL